MYENIYVPFGESESVHQELIQQGWQFAGHTVSVGLEPGMPSLRHQVHYRRLFSGEPLPEGYIRIPVKTPEQLAAEMGRR